MVGTPTTDGTEEKAFFIRSFSEILTEIRVDEYRFKVTMHPWMNGECVLWFCDSSRRGDYEALGRFSHFNKRDVLFFISRYATSPDLRAEIDGRRFERRAAGITREFLVDVERRSRVDKISAFRNLFNLDLEIDPGTLARRRRILARRFHPDAGGDNRTMSLINEAYNCLSREVHR